MRSIPWAMCWAMLSRERWALAFAVLAANAVPIAILKLLQIDAALFADDQSGVVMHIMLVQLNMLIFGSAILISLGRPSQLYAWPIRTSTLVAWRLLPAMALVATESVLSTLLLNRLFGLDWPVWGPAAFLAVGLAAVCAAVWLTERSGWMILAIAIVGLILGMWNKARYGAMFSPPTHLWRQVTAGEVAFLLGVAVVAYMVAVAAVSRNRRGEPPLSVGIIARIKQFLDSRLDADRTLPSPAAAQFRFVWKRGGWAMPGLFSAALLFGLTVWLFSPRDPQEFWDGLLGLSPLLPWFGLVGALLLCSPILNESDQSMRQFMATRPMTSAAMGQAVLRAGAASIALMWCVWIAAALVTGGLVAANGVNPLPAFQGLRWYYWPAAILATWIVTTLTCSVLLSGRLKEFLQFGCGIAIIVISQTTVSHFTLSPEAQASMFRALAIAIGVICVMGTVAAYLAALRRRHIGMASIYVAVSAWGAMIALITSAAKQHPEAALTGFVFFVGLAALVVAPFAAVPLAIAWNRHR